MRIGTDMQAKKCKPASCTGKINPPSSFEVAGTTVLAPNHKANLGIARTPAGSLLKNSLAEFPQLLYEWNHVLPLS